MIRNVVKSGKTAVALALLGVFGAGCATPIANGPEHAMIYDKRFPISVEPQMSSLGVRVDAGMQGLDPAETARVEQFAEAWKARGQGAITVSAPNGSPNHRAAHAAMAQTVAILVKSGVPKRMIVRTGYPASEHPGEPPVTLSYVGLTAVAPDCSTLGWPDNLAETPRNQPWANFGCATQSNLAAMIANPRDLVEPQPMGPVDMQRRHKMLEDYRKARATQTARKSDESGTVSTAATASGGQ